VLKPAGAAQVLLVNSTNDYINSGALQTIPVFTPRALQGNAVEAYRLQCGTAVNDSFPRCATTGSADKWQASACRPRDDRCGQARVQAPRCKHSASVAMTYAKRTEPGCTFRRHVDGDPAHHRVRVLMRVYIP